jgi:hypothetical protein
LPTDFERELENLTTPIYKRAIGKIQTRMVDGRYHWCSTCKNYITKGRMPPKSNQNNLQLFDLQGYDEL